MSDSFEFAGQLFYSRDHWLRAIAESWLTGDGLNDRDEIEEWLNTLQPIQFATECLEGWFAGEFTDQAPSPEELEATFVTLAEDRAWLDEVNTKK